MRVQKINNVIPNLQKTLQPIKSKKDGLLNKCSEIRHKKLNEISSKDIPFLTALIGFCTPLPFGFFIGYGFGKIIEWTVNIFNKNK